MSPLMYIYSDLVDNLYVAMTSSNQFLKFFFGFFIFATVTSSFAQIPQTDQKQYQQALSELMVGKSQVFRENVGQWDNEILFQSSGSNAIASFYQDKVAFTLRNNLRSEGDLGYDPSTARASFMTWNLIIDGANKGNVSPSSDISRNINYFGPKSPGGTKIEEYERLDYFDIYPNIDLTFYSAKTGALKYDYILKPGSSVHDIQMKYEGVQDVKVLNDGKLLLKTDWGDFTEDKPYSYQIINGIKHEVEVDYVICDGKVTFEIKGDYNADFDLIIDPIYLDWSTFFYGEKAAGAAYQWTWILDVDIDDEDYVYITGMTSEAYPGTLGSYDTSLNGYYDAFVCKITPKGDSIRYFSYLGGSSYDYGMNLTVNSIGQPVVSGLTWGGNFPTTKDAFDSSGRSTSGSYYQGFVSKFSANGDSLIFSTYLSGKNGTGYDWIRGMTMNDAGDIFLVGNTQSDDFPTTKGCFQPTNAGQDGTGNYYTRGDGFLTCLSSDGKSLKFSTFIGGSRNESAYDVYLDENDDIYVVGTTSSGNFPLTPGAGIFNKYIKGTFDGFVMKFKSNGNQLIFSKIMGGTGDDAFEGIYSNKRGEPFIAGYTNSNDFPTTKNAVQKASAGGYDFVIVKMISSGTNVRWSTYLGGSGNEYYYSSPFFSTVKITANVKDEAIISGISQSQNFPVTSDALQSTNKSTYYWKQNLTISKLSYGGDRIVYATYFGGSQWEWPGSVKTKRVGCVSYILSAGITASADYPTTKGVYKDSIRTSGTGWWSGFVSKFRDTLYTEKISLAFQDTIIECDNVFQILDAQNQGADILWSDGWKDRYKIAQDSGTLWVRATYGCDTVHDTITIELEHSPKIPILASDTIYCDNFPNLTLDAKNDTIYRSYLWSTGDTNQKINVDAPGTYFVDISTPNCGTKTDTVHLRLLKTPDVDLGVDPIACDTVNMLLDAKNENNDVLYSWNTTDSTQTIIALDTGLYWVTVGNFCGMDSSSILLNKLVQPVAILPSDSIFCDDVFVLLSGGEGKNGEEYVWSSLDGSVEYATTKAFLATKEKDIRLEVKNKCGNSMDSMLITLIETPALGFQNTLYVCDLVDEKLTIGQADNSEYYSWNTGSSTDEIQAVAAGKYVGVVTNKCGADTSIWDIDLAFTPKVQLPNDTTYCGTINLTLDVQDSDPKMIYQWQDGSSSPTYPVNQEGSYWVTISNRCGDAGDSVNFKLLQKPSVNLGSDKVFCGGVTPFDLKVGSENNDEIYEWSSSEVTNSINVNQDGDHWVIIKNICGTASDTFNVRISQIPVVDLGPDTILCGNFSLGLDAGNIGMKYLWLPYGETTRTIKAEEQRVYQVEVTNGDGCKGTDEFEIGSGCVSHVYIPSSFTPNSDGLNDIFKPSLVNFENFSMSVHNRWGELMFESNNIENGWDGTYKGTYVQPGVYLYSIRFITTEDGRFHNESGLIQAIR
jgi:gliding motility-associated-like protein